MDQVHFYNKQVLGHIFVLLILRTCPFSNVYCSFRHSSDLPKIRSSALPPRCSALAQFYHVVKIKYIWDTCLGSLRSQDAFQPWNRSIEELCSILSFRLNALPFDAALGYLSQFGTVSLRLLAICHIRM